MSRGDKLVVAMVGLPAMGKSTVALKLKENLEKEDVRVAVFNNGDVRRRLLPGNTAHAGFYDPENAENVTLRERIAGINMAEAKAFLSAGGQIAILDATNASPKRRETIRATFADMPLLFIECRNDDPALLDFSIERKIRGAEFARLSPAEAKKSFRERIGYYRHILRPLSPEDGNGVILDSLNNRILVERADALLPYYARIRDLLVSDWVKSLILVRHGQSEDNVAKRIGGDSSLTETGRAQAWALSRHFIGTPIPYVFTSTKTRTQEMADPLVTARNYCSAFAFAEFDEIDAGECEGMTPAEIKETRPEVYAARSLDKYRYTYPGGESYAMLAERVERGLKKAFFLSGNAENILIVGHQAVNRVILSHFLFRRAEDVPYIYIPQDRYFHIVSTHTKKLFELKKF